MKSNNLVWGWRNALFTAVIATIPVIIIVPGHVEAGLSLLLGALPASIRVYLQHVNSVER